MGTLFFVLLILAALTSSIGLLEVVVSWLTEETSWSRRTLAIVAGVVTWIIESIGTSVASGQEIARIAEESGLAAPLHMASQFSLMSISMHAVTWPIRRKGEVGCSMAMTS